LTFDVKHFQLPDDWELGSLEDFRLAVLYTEESDNEWDAYKYMLQNWLTRKTTPWDPTSSIYLYHQIRFALQYLTEKHAFVKTAQAVFQDRMKRKGKGIDNIHDDIVVPTYNNFYSRLGKRKRVIEDIGDSDSSDSSSEEELDGWL
jgi:hypothetical protein